MQNSSPTSRAMPVKLVRRLFFKLSGCGKIMRRLEPTKSTHHHRRASHAWRDQDCQQRQGRVRPHKRKFFLDMIEQPIAFFQTLLGNGFHLRNCLEVRLQVSASPAVLAQGHDIRNRTLLPARIGEGFCDGPFRKIEYVGKTERHEKSQLIPCNSLKRSLKFDHSEASGSVLKVRALDLTGLATARNSAAS